MSEALDHVVTGWTLSPGLVAALTAVCAAYLAGLRRARRWPAARTAAFLGGVAVLAVALQSGLHSGGERSLSVHMVQHVLLTAVAPPLLLAGAPVVLALRTLPPRPRRAVAELVMGPAGRLLTHPLVALALFIVVLVGSHVPAVYEAALRSPLLHHAEHVAYLGSALLFWVPVLAVEPLPRAPSPIVRLLLAMATMPAMAAVGLALANASGVVYAPYADVGGAFGLAPLDDQRLAGTIMWIGGSAAVAAVAVTAGWHAVQLEERRALARERRGGAP